MKKSGQLDKAIEAYDQALKLNPDNQDAQFNKEKVEEALEQQKQQQQEQDKNQQQADLWFATSLATRKHSCFQVEAVTI
jgi:Ca-activated chloride channel family protein